MGRPDPAATALYNNKALATTTSSATASSLSRSSAHTGHSLTGTNSGAPPGSAGRRNRNRRNGGGQGGGHGGAPWPSFNPWTGTIQMWPDNSSGGQQQRSEQPPMRPLPQALLAALVSMVLFLVFLDLLPNRPLQHQATPLPPTAFPIQDLAPSNWTPSWDQQQLASTFNTMTLRPPLAITDWIPDSGASNHTTPTSDNISTLHPLDSTTPIIVGNGTTLSITSVGDTVFPVPFTLITSFVLPI
jgi:hypothetical protein